MTYNLFDLPKMANNEKLHSAFIAWLLNPKETHGLEDKFLKGFLIKINEKIKDNISKVEINNCNSVDVFNEFPFEFMDTNEKKRGAIDIFVKNLNKKFIIVIENKITTRARKEQLNKYVNFIKNTYHPEYKSIFVLLAPDVCTNPLENDYIKITYTDILNMIKKIPNYQDKDFLNDYISVINSIEEENQIVKEKKESLLNEINKNNIAEFKIDNTNHYDLFTHDISKNAALTIEYKNKKYYLNFSINPIPKSRMANFQSIEKFEKNNNNIIKNLTKHYNQFGYYWVSEELGKLDETNIQDKIKNCKLLSDDIINFSEENHE